MATLAYAYISEAVKPFSEADLTALLKIARDNNAKLGVTGMMLYEGQRFLQILEGAPEIVMQLAEKIERDPRHHRIVRMSAEMIDKRHFKDWSMGFKHVSSGTLKDQIPGFNDFFQTGEKADNFIGKENINVFILINAFKRILEGKAVPS